MSQITYTFLGDGSSDAALRHIINWLISQKRPDLAILGRVADLRFMPNPPKTLEDRISLSLDLFPAQILFVHRDAETNNGFDLRVQEIENSIRGVNLPIPKEHIVKIIPVRMMETWLLIDSEAIKIAAGNRNFRGNLALPRVQQLQNTPRPKELLCELLYQASEKRGRARAKMNVREAIHIVAEKISDFTPLRTLPAFKALELGIETVLRDMRLVD